MNKREWREYHRAKSAAERASRGGASGPGCFTIATFILGLLVLGSAVGRLFVG